MTPEQKQRMQKLEDRARTAISAALEHCEFRPLPSWGDVDFLLSLVKSQEAGDIAPWEEDIKTAIFKVISESDQWRFYSPKEGQSQRADFAGQVTSLLRRNQRRLGPEWGSGLEPLLRLQQIISRIALVADMGSADEFGDAIERLRLISEMAQFDDKAGTTRAQSDLNDAASTRSACVEKVKAAVLSERETKRIGSQIVGDVLAQMGVRGSKEEREGADVVATAWVAKIIERVSEECAVKLETLSIEQPKE